LVRSTTSGTTETLATYVHVVATTTEPSSYIWQLSSSRTASGVMAAYVGVNTTSPVDVSNGAASASGTSIVVQSVTISVDGELLLGLFAAAANATITPPTGMLEQMERIAGTGNTRALSELSDQQLGTAGATGT